MDNAEDPDSSLGPVGAWRRLALLITLAVPWTHAAPAAAQLRAAPVLVPSVSAVPSAAVAPLLTAPSAITVALPAASIAALPLTAAPALPISAHQVPSSPRATDAEASARPVFALAQEAWSARGGSPWPFEARAPFSAGDEFSAPYGLPSAQPAATRKVLPTADETKRMRAEYERISRDGEEFFDAPTWVEKALEPALKAAFGVAGVEDIMLDFANAVQAEIPAKIQGDPVAALAAMRAREFARWREAVGRLGAAPRSPAQAYALKRLEALHAAGVLPPGLERPAATFPALRAAYARLHAIAFGAAEGDLAEAKRMMSAFARELAGAAEALRRDLRARRAAVAADADAAIDARPTKVSPAEAKLIYERSLREAKDASDPENVRHSMARLAAMRARTLLASPNLGRQVRPTCTLHMLRGLLAAMGIRKTMPQLVREARALLNDPLVGSVTAFDDAAQLRLFKHYGVVEQLNANLFKTLVERRRNLKIRIEIGDPVYKHSLVLEGLYELDGRTWVSLRDSTSYFPTRMALADFARVLLTDPALYFSSAWAAPR